MASHPGTPGSLCSPSNQSPARVVQEESVRRAEFSEFENSLLSASPLLGPPLLPHDPSAGPAPPIGASPGLGLSSGEISASSMPLGPLAGRAVGVSTQMSLQRPVFDPAQEESASKKFLYQASPEVHGYIEKHFTHLPQ